MKEVRYINRNIMSVHFKFESRNEFDKTLVLVKTLTGRTYIKARRCWNIPILSTSIESLIKWGFTIDEKLEDWYIKNRKKQDIQLELNFPEELGLYEFQKKGVEFIEIMKGRCLISDEMGLGKTIQSLIYLKIHPEIRPTIVVCPASLKLNWAKEIKKWGLKDSLTIINGRKPKEVTLNKDYGIYIINYDILPDITEIKIVYDEQKKKEKKIKVGIPNTGWASWLKEIEPKCVILDESHKIANEKNLRTKAVRNMCKKVKHIICLTGTPITSKPKQIWTTLNLLNKHLFPGFWDFGMRYCDPKHNGFGWNWNGASNIEELNKLLVDNIMIRRLKKDVLKDLPKLQRVTISIEMDSREEYDAIESDMSGIAKYQALTQIAVREKLNNCIKWIEDFLESGEKLIVFAVHHEIIDLLKTHFDKVSVKLDGRDNIAERQLAVEKFQTYDDIKLFVGNIQAAGEGITLTAASNACFIEFSWIPAEHDQAESRPHRIGQENAVTAWYLIAENTIEEEQFAIVDRKRKIVNSVIDGRKTKDDELLTELLAKFKEKYGMVA